MSNRTYMIESKHTQSRNVSKLTINLPSITLQTTEPNLNSSLETKKEEVKATCEPSIKKIIIKMDKSFSYKDKPIHSHRILVKSNLHSILIYNIIENLKYGIIKKNPKNDPVSYSMLKQELYNGQ